MDPLHTIRPLRLAPSLPLATPSAGSPWRPVDSLCLSTAPAAVSAVPGQDPRVDVGAAMRAVQRLEASRRAGVQVLWSVPVSHFNPRGVPLPGGGVCGSGLSGRIQGIRADGSVAWTQRTGGLDISAEPCVSPSGTIYVSRMRHLEAHDPVDGHELWSRRLSGDLGKAVAAGQDGRCYVQGELQMYAVDEHTGGVAWTVDVQRAWSDEPPHVAPDGTVYVADRRSVVHAFGPDGRQRWACRELEQEPSRFGPSAIIPGMVVGKDGTLYCVTHELPSYEGALHAIGPDGGLKWSLPLPEGGPNNYGHPAVDGEGTVYVGVGRRDREEVLAVSPEGQVLWRRDVKPLLHLTGLPGQGVVVGQRGGYLFALDGKGERGWTCDVGSTFTKPTFGPHGEMYAGCDQRLFAFQVPSLDAGQLVEEARSESETPAPSPTIRQEDGWVVIGDVRVPVRRAEMA